MRSAALSAVIMMVTWSPFMGAWGRGLITVMVMSILQLISWLTHVISPMPTTVQVVCVFESDIHYVHTM